MESLLRKLAPALFALLVLAGPLLFGAVDRPVQIGLTLAIGIGFLLVPPTVPILPPWLKWTILLSLAFFAAKEFLPFRWFGETLWHRILTHDFSVVFPLTHNPEPSRGLDAILAAAVAGAWFVWVRTLAAERKERLVLAWCMFGAAAVFALVCLAFGTRSDLAIYGVRNTPGWSGFGAFPNRNHTAAFLAMGALIGCGCTAQAGRRKKWVLLISGIAGLGAIFIAMLESRSRGGFMGFGCGLLVFGALSLVRLRSRAALISTVAVLLIGVGLFFAFGSQLLARFSEAPSDENILQNARWDIWHDALRMWKDAPVFGHGLGIFAQLFPMYQQRVNVAEYTVLHPESSWLQWLVEFGALPTFLIAAVLAFFLTEHMVAAFEHERGFFIRAGGFAAIAALLCHSIWDVPAHRWGTAGFAIAALAIACPLRPGNSPRVTLSRTTALVPLAVAGFWLMPFLFDKPKSSPALLARLVEKCASEPSVVSTAEVENALRFFPLSYDLHHALGLRMLAVGHDSEQAWREFRIANRLAPFSWRLPAMQAWVSRRYSAGMSLHFWSVAIEQSGPRAGDIFLAALQNTRDVASAAAFWKSYTSDHPEFLLIYAASLSNPQDARAAFERWWQTRGLTASEIKPYEAHSFYDHAPEWSSFEQCETWMKRHPERERPDLRQWTELLHFWRRDDLAWQLLTRWIKEPQFPETRHAPEPSVLEARWRANPQDHVSAQTLAGECVRRGETDRARQVIFTVAATKDPPPWFVQKAAYLRAADGDYAAAVATLLQHWTG